MVISNLYCWALLINFPGFIRQMIMANSAVSTSITSKPSHPTICSFVNKPAAFPMVEINQAAMGK